MLDLATPVPKQAPEPTPVSTPSSTKAPVETIKYVQSESVSSQKAITKPPPSEPQSNEDIEDLDALMESLNKTSERTRRPVSARSNAPKSDSISKTPADDTEKIVSPPKQSPPANVSTTPSSTNGPSKAAPVLKNDDLDNLLNNLTKQMDDIDSDNPASRGTCGQCKKPILGEVIQALGHVFHPEHFLCSNCHDPLGTRNFFESNGLPHCEKCYKEMFCPRCSHCNGAILDRCITALGKKWHIEHFICTQCLKPFPGGNFFERDGKPYCENDFFSLFAPKCGSCGEAIRGDCINALGSQWHPDHFVCHYCQKAFTNGTFFEYQGKPYCETHYHHQTGSLCAGCGKPIGGRCVNALDKKWHPEHFVCAFCMNPLAGGAFTEQNSKAYCKECHGKLFVG